jgi:hypothetical protein
VRLHFVLVVLVVLEALLLCLLSLPFFVDF